MILKVTEELFLVSYVHGVKISNLTDSKYYNFLSEFQGIVHSLPRS